MNNNTSLKFGSLRFTTAVANNRNEVMVSSRFPGVAKLVDAQKDVLLCLPRQVESWGNYPTHQQSWLSLAFVVACHARHNDDEGLKIRKEAFNAIPDCQWPALIATAVDFVSQLRERLADGAYKAKKAYKPATRALQDCLLYAGGGFPENQDAFLADSSVAQLVERANRGRAGELDSAEGYDLADEIDTLCQNLAAEYGGLQVCRDALTELEAFGGPLGEVTLLPEGTSLEEGASRLMTSAPGERTTARAI